MLNQTLFDYVKTNLKAGFSEEEIKKAATEAGWEKAEIVQAFRLAALKPPSFWRRAKKYFKKFGLLAAALILLIGGALVLSKNFDPKIKNNSSQVLGETLPLLPPTSLAEIKKRDETRLSDIKLLQEGLAKFFAVADRYPKNLDELISMGLIKTVPKDPKTGKAYLYIPLLDPPLHYSLSFILEAKTQDLKPGFHTVSP